VSFFKNKSLGTSDPRKDLVSQYFNEHIGSAITKINGYGRVGMVHSQELFRTPKSLAKKGTRPVNSLIMN